MNLFSALESSIYGFAVVSPRFSDCSAISESASWGESCINRDLHLLLISLEFWLVWTEGLNSYRKHKRFFFAPVFESRAYIRFVLEEEIAQVLALTGRKCHALILINQEQTFKFLILLRWTATLPLPTSKPPDQPLQNLRTLLVAVWLQLLLESQPQPARPLANLEEALLCKIVKLADWQAPIAPWFRELIRQTLLAPWRETLYLTWLKVRCRSRQTLRSIGVFYHSKISCLKTIKSNFLDFRIRRKLDTMKKRNLRHIASWSIKWRKI